MATNFDDVFNAAQQPEPAAEQPTPKKATSKPQMTPQALPPKPDPWAEVPPKEKEGTRFGSMGKFRWG